MKKFCLYLTGVFLSVLFLTSCLEGSNVREEIGYGVLEFGGANGITPVLKSSVGHFSGASVMSLYNTGAMDIDGCYAYYFRIDFDQPENSSSIVELNGYQTVTILDFVELSKFYVSSYLNDITQILPDEMPLMKACNGLDYVSRYLFISHTANHPDEWKLSWEMSYDNAMLTMPIEENGKRYYDLYLRARVQNKSDKTSKVETQYTNVYFMGDFLTTVASLERSLLEGSYSENSSQFTLRFNYVSDLDEETNSMTWQSDEVDFYIAGFLESSSWY